MTNSLRVDYAIHFHRRDQGAAQEIGSSAETGRDVPPCVPRLARLMALAIRLESLVRTGAVRDYAQLAQLGQVSRARLSQIMALIHLAPEIQEALLFLGPIPRGRATLRLADLQPLANLADWSKQRRYWRRLRAAKIWLRIDRG